MLMSVVRKCHAEESRDEASGEGIFPHHARLPTQYLGVGATRGLCHSESAAGG